MVITNHHGTEAIRRRIREFDGFLIAADLVKLGNGSEELFTVDVHGRSDIGNHCWGEDVALRFVIAHQDFGTLIDGSLYLPLQELSG